MPAQDLQHALAGQLVGIAAQGQGQGQPGQILLVGPRVQAARRYIQGPVQLLAGTARRALRLPPLPAAASRAPASFTESTCLRAQIAVR